MTENRVRRIAAAVVATAAVVTLSSCGSASAQTGSLPTDREIVALFDDWNAALGTGDPDKVLARYADNATLLPTVSPGVLDSKEEIRAYFADTFLPKSPSGVITDSVVRVLDSDTAVHSGLYTFTVKDAAGASQQVKARFTFVYERTADGWKIVEHQSSVEPGTA